MFTVEDETFRQARAIVSMIAAELVNQRESGSSRPVDLGALIRSAAPTVLVGSESEYVRGIAERLQKSFPIEELFPRKRRRGSA